MRSLKYLFIICALLLVSSIQVVSAGSGYSYVTQWNSTGQEGGNFILPSGITVDSAGNVYVVDNNAQRVLKFDSSGIYLPWSSPDLGSWSFRDPVGIAVDRAGNIYVTNRSSASPVEKFDSSGMHLPWSSPNAFAEISRQPYGIAVDSAGNIYVCVYFDKQVLKFDSSGTLLPWGDASNPADLFKSPFGVAVDSANNVYVADTLNKQVQKFNSAGRLLPWSPSGLAGYPFGVAVDSAGNVFVSGVEKSDMDNRGSTPEDTGDQWIEKFSPSGDLITKLGSSGSGDMQFHYPFGVAVDSTGNVFVADSYNSRVQKLSPDTPAGPSITAGFYAFGHVGQAPYSVRFLDQSAGSPTAWKWDFGDGSTSPEQNPTHIFNHTGAYNVALTASNDQASDTCTQYRCVIVNALPTANFTANATAGRTPFTVQFTDQSTSATEYQWQFGDGQTSTDQNPAHTYTVPGTYTVTLTISVPDYGSVFMQKTGYITVTDPPTVGFSANVTAGLAPLAVQFNESTNGSVQYFYWRFGDGLTSYEQNPVHVYNTAGRYTVSLYAIGSNGTQVKTVDDYINVTAPVTPAPTTPAPVNTTSVPTTLVPTTTGTPVPTNTTVAPTVTTIVPTVTNPAYNGPHTLPGTLQAEDYDLGGEGVAYHDTTAGNIGEAYRQDDVDIEVLDTDGSPNVGWIRAGEWMAYTVNVSTAGTYDAGFRVASSHSGSSVQVYVDNGTTPVATVNVPNTGDWPVFRTVPVPVTLPAGQHRLVLSFPTDYVNINWISFARNGGL